MDTSSLKKFAQHARRSLREQVAKKLALVLADDSAARRQSAAAVKQLEDAIKKHSKDQVVEKVAYTWFNRFCALRFMDVNRYTKIGIVSPTEGQSQPEILAEAKMGHVDEQLVPEKSRQAVISLLRGEAASADPQSDAYRLLLVAACNFYHSAMPFLFERIDDFTELLLPDDLLSESSILNDTRNAMTVEACENVEVIGWLYQFYISEKKDEVFAGLKKNTKITPEHIPAATQLFTPHWIVCYLVENSLGRLWMLNRPGSKLIEKMEYYIAPEEVETDFLRVESPEELKICDPACGSGHMLVYAFDLLYAIYEEEGYEPSEIPEKILTHNLFGIEIDERAGALAAFALTMKAREKYRRFFRKKVQPNICVLESIEFTDGELNDYMDFVGRNLFTTPLLETLQQFSEADNFGSLIRPVVTDVQEMLRLLESKDVSGQLFLYQVHRKVLQVLQQADYLSPKYHVVVANPPYMGGKGMNGRLGSWVKENYPNSKSDLFATFIERGFELIPKLGFNAMVTMQSWMFLSSYEKLRNRLMKDSSIECMVHMANMVMGIAFGTAATIWKLGGQPSSPGSFCYVEYEDIGRDDKPVKFPPENTRNKIVINNPDCGWFFRASASDFKKIPGSPIAYWVSERFRKAFLKSILFQEIASPKQGIATANNDLFLRRWYELSFSSIYIGLQDQGQTTRRKAKWLPYNKGGSFRKWYGNNEFVINWLNNGEEIRSFCDENGKQRSAIRNPDYYFLPSVTWTDISSSAFGVRRSDKGFLFDGSSHSAFPKEETLNFVCGFLGSSVAFEFLKVINPTMHFQVGNIAVLPILNEVLQDKILIEKEIDKLVSLSRSDWDCYETSWNFESSPLTDYRRSDKSILEAYKILREAQDKMIRQTKTLEENNNDFFINGYELKDEVNVDVPISNISLHCNPYYRYDHTKPEAELEALLLADTMKEFLSYAVGSMFGRYSLDKPGLILANQGETIEDYNRQVPERSFPPDEDNVLPVLDGDWFIDDITERFRKFLRVTFGEEHYEENLKFIEKAIGKKIRAYFIKDFYNDHVKRYKKRPIYWLFSSPKGSFNALIYMHRYRPDTVSVVLNDYLREFRGKLKARVTNLKQLEVSADASQSQKTKAIKEITKLTKIIEELNDYEREILYPLALKQIDIDLDDGVKVNYPKFGAALKKITGLEAKKK